MTHRSALRRLRKELRSRRPAFRSAAVLGTALLSAFCSDPTDPSKLPPTAPAQAGRAPAAGSGGDSGAPGSSPGGESSGRAGGAQAGTSDLGGSSSAAGGSAGAQSPGAGAGGAALGGSSADSGQGGLGGSAGSAGSDALDRASVLEALVRANEYFMKKWPDPGADIVTNKTRPSNIWTRGVYYEGLMALNGVHPDPRYVKYAVDWGDSHSWGLQGGSSTRHADNHCAGQTYLDLYVLQERPEQLRDIKRSIDAMLGGGVGDWTWIDALQMAMPVFVKLGLITGDPQYFARMYAFYHHTKNVQGGSGLYSPTDHLWWRDRDFNPPYTEPNGKSCYWSRGNGWVYAALVRVLDELPESDAHREEYRADFLAMSEALRPLQRQDGFWGVSLHDPTHFPGPELSGTSLFVYGMAWGIEKGWLSESEYLPRVERGWTAMASAVHESGALGWVQSTGKQPSDGQPLAFDKLPDFEDYGLGCFLLGGTEVAKLAR